ncbi:MAG: ABC transporter permease [Candidatus Zixiibacteriota bacterium]|nr:MAG: ABC transporter permease [candidate division Zixibacteria bacterium]
MIKNYLTVAIRNILRHKGYATINIAGLALGIACCIILALFVRNELTYDRYHEGAERIYRVAEHRKVPAGEFRSPQVSPAVALAIKSGQPGVENAVRIDRIFNGLIERQGLSCYEDRMYYADPEIFQVFSIPFVKGNPHSALVEPLTVVISESIAARFYGDEDPVGQTILLKDPFMARLNDEYSGLVEYRITGVVEDAPSNTHFKYDVIVSLAILAGNQQYESWYGGGAYTYVKLREGIDAIAFEENIRRLAHEFEGSELSAWGQERDYYLQPLTGIHFDSKLTGFTMMPGRGEMETPGNYVYLYIYSVIGLLILVIGCMNFINLSTAHSVRRAREVGLRKVVGAGRFQLIGQYLGESVTITAISLIMALLLAELALPLFNEYAGTTLQLEQLLYPESVMAVGGLVLFVGIVAGCYPAFVLASIKPTLTLKGSSSAGTRGSFLLRTMVVGQFGISMFLAICTVTVHQQLEHMRSQGIGFDMEQKLVIPFRFDRHVRSRWEVLRSELVAHHSITGAAASSSVPGRWTRSGFLSYEEGILDPPKELRFISCDPNFLPLYEIEIVAGRPFSDSTDDDRRSFLINEAAVSYLGYSSPEAALGERLWESWLGRQKEIVGVTANFHYAGLQHDVEPLFMEFSDSRFDALTLMIAPGRIDEALDYVEAKWSELFPSTPFEAFFLDNAFDHQYRTERQMGQLMSLLSGLGLTVACLGLLGLVSFTARQRAQEIAIRRVLGAPTSRITLSMSVESAVLIALSGIVACPLAYAAASRWLENFAHTTEIDVWTLGLPVGLATILSLTTVVVCVFRAARANPVEALKYE